MFVYVCICMYINTHTYTYPYIYKVLYDYPFLSVIIYSDILYSLPDDSCPLPVNSDTIRMDSCNVKISNFLRHLSDKSKISFFPLVVYVHSLT